MEQSLMVIIDDYGLRNGNLVRFKKGLNNQIIKAQGNEPGSIWRINQPAPYIDSYMFTDGNTDYEFSIGDHVRIDFVTDNFKQNPLEKPTQQDLELEAKKILEKEIKRKLGSNEHPHVIKIKKRIIRCLKKGIEFNLSQWGKNILERYANQKYHIPRPISTASLKPKYLVKRLLYPAELEITNFPRFPYWSFWYKLKQLFRFSKPIKKVKKKRSVFDFIDSLDIQFEDWQKKELLEMKKV